MSATAPRAVLLDTCALIWFAEGRLTAPVLEILEHAAEHGGVFVSPVSAWEIGLLVRSRRGNRTVQFLPDPQSWFADIVRRPEIREAPLSWPAALAASSLPEPVHADPADRLLIATARESGISILTADRQILAYSKLGHVRAVPC